MRLTLRIDSQNLIHTHLTVFVNRANCGTLTLDNNEYDELVHWLSLGKRENEFIVSGLDGPECDVRGLDKCSTM